MDRDRVLAVCRGLPGAAEGFPFSATAAVFTVSGKMFALVDIGDGPASVSLKCDPGYAVALREQYPAVTAGYHLNKRHWNTVNLDESVPDDVLQEWIQDSYDLVVAGLPRARRAT
ncbi:MAG TPA: MmcQ/YjbR family DNA-binding protein [Chloroflexota bacterium]|nr:MmcQ/YjbR family DNA-binding protein [Chloroflexota bacterium]